MSKYVQKYLLIGICCIFFLLPFFSFPGYSLGGDDARLYYLFPTEYFKNYLFQIMSGNGLGGNMAYMPVSYAAPMISLIYIVKTVLPMINVQHVFYGLNISLGFLFCYLFLRLQNKTKINQHAFAAMLASCLYVTSAYIVKTMYQSELIMMYLVMLVPLFLYTFTRGLEDKDMRYIVGSAVVILFSSSLLSLPWLYPFLLVSIPYFIYCAVRYKAFFWKSLIVFSLVSVGLHWYWLVHGVVSIVSSRLDTSLMSLIASKEFIQEAENTIYSSMFLNGPIHQIAGYLRTSWTDHNPMPVWNFIGSIPLLLVALAGMNLRGIKKDVQLLFGVILLSLCTAIFMITPNMGKWNMDVFLFFNKTIPLFTIIKNMYGKFGLALAFFCAWALFLSLTILLQKRQKIWTWISFGLGIILLLYQLPLFLNAQGIGISRPYITNLSSDYMQLTQYISTLTTTKRFVWYPMTFPGYTPIQDDVKKDSLYLGISPLQILAGKSDIAGFYGIQTPIDPYRNWKILELFKQQKYEEVVATLASYNIGYVITLNDPLPEAVTEQLNQFFFMTLQTDIYKRILLGKKVTDIGRSYSLYEMNPKYSFDTVFLTNDALDIHAAKETVKYRRIKTNIYEVTLPADVDSQSLVLLTPYHALWTISVPKTVANIISFTDHRVAYGYGNVWDIQKTGNFDGLITCTIEFVPDRLTMPSVIVSCIVFIGCCIYICYKKKRR